MLFWEWRRIWRQKIRSLAPRTKLTYQQYSKRRLIVAFVTFFVGWKMFGVAFSDWMLWTVDEETGQGHMLTPEEARKRRIELERERDRKIQKKSESKKALPRFEFDD
ncbi:hypothetical protein TELCIR_13713 [Teladorsagia circumcincta]|uniref:Uncharacterized protein n=1 Tax=Teladorsagia circumcincta TaxID=45464 RepID=A0A2G9U309_TELCI|nr:hypothetical protein TELCIR_13713 [Teladorsagia circumcincta]